MAAFDMDNPKAVVSPGGVGFDINCGVRLLRTNLTEGDVTPIKVLCVDGGQNEPLAAGSVCWLHRIVFSILFFKVLESTLI